MNDPIIDEIRQYRDAHAARFNYDLKAIYEDIKRREKEWEKKLGRKFVSYAEGPVEPPPNPAAVPVSTDANLPDGDPGRRALGCG
jgi:rubrerythrin